MQAPTVAPRRTRTTLALELHELALRCAEAGLTGHAERLLAEARGLSAELDTAGPAGSRGELHPAPLVVPLREAASGPVVGVTSLGQFAITRGGMPLESCRSRRAIWLLRYLLAAPANAAHKGELASDLWPDATGDRAQHSLHVAVAALREYLDPAGARDSTVRFANDRYFLSPDVVMHDDCASFQALVALGDRCWQRGETELAGRAFNAALALYRGDYDLAELEFDWAIEEQRRHIATYLHALWRAGVAAQATGDYEAATACYRRLLARDPYREDVVAELMTAYATLGRRGDVARAYGRCVHYLEGDLGVEPARELTSLYRRLVGADPTPRSLASV